MNRQMWDCAMGLLAIVSLVSGLAWGNACAAVLSRPVGELTIGVNHSTYSNVGHVTAILPDGDRVWAGTKDGELVSVNPTTGEMWRYRYPKVGAILRDLARDGRGHIWVATEGGALGRFDGQTWATYTPDLSGFPSLNVRAVVVDETERVWAATDAGAALWSNGQWTVFNRANSGLISDDVTSVAVGWNVWFGTDKGLSVLGKGQWDTPKWAVFQSSNSSLPHDRILSLALDRSGDLWTGTENGWVRTRDGSEWWTSSAVTGPVYDIAIDASGEAWFNLGQRVGHLTECSWTAYSASEIGLKTSSIIAMALDARARLWIGAEGGLAMLEPRETQGVWSATGVDQTVPAMAVRGQDLWFMADGAAGNYNLNSGQHQFTLPEYGLGAPVSAIAIGSDGSVWFATWGRGLTVFDGQGWEVYDASNTPLPSDYIGAVLAVPDGLLIGTSQGLVYRQSDKWNVYSFQEIGLEPTMITAIAVSLDGRLAVGTAGNGISIYDGRQWTSYHTSNSGLLSNYVSSLVFDRMGNLWVGTQGSGLGCFDGKEWTAHSRGPGGPDGNFVRALALDRGGALWVGTEDGGLSQFDGCQWTTYEPPTAVGSTMPVYALAVDENGVIWVGAERGLWSFEPPPLRPATSPPPIERIKHGTVQSVPAIPYPAAQGVPDGDRWITHGVGKSVHHMAFADDTLWVATMDGGAVRWNLSDGTFTRFLYPQDGIGSNKVVYIAIDPLGRVWCATHRSGVSVYDGSKWTVYDTRNSGLSHDNVNAIAFDMAGRVWLATLGGGVSVFDGQNWTVYNTQNSGIAGDFVWQVAIDQQGRLWAGCMDGLSVFDGQTWYTYPDTSNVHCVSFDSQGGVWFGDGSRLNRVEGRQTVNVFEGVPKPYTRDVYAIAFDAQGSIWLGAANGIFRFDGQNLVQLDLDAAGLRGSQVFAVTIGPDGRVWVGGDGEDGIACFDGTRWRYYSTVYGANPPSPDVISSLVDAQGRVWLGTDRGVTVYDGATWTTYTTDNSALLDNRVQAIAQDSTGRIWLGTSRGINLVAGSTITALEPAAPNPDVNDILFDRQGRVWTGHSEGLSVFNGQTWQTFTPDNSPLAANDINSLALDGQGRVWMASFWSTVLTVFDGDTWTVFQPEDYGAKSAFSTAVVEADFQGDIWVATSEGLARFDGAQWTRYPFAAWGVENRSVSSLAFDAAGRLWVGSYGYVDRIEAERLVSYTVDNSPLVGENVWTLSIDRQGHVWIGVALGGVSELIPAAQRFPMTPTSTPLPSVATPPSLPTPLPTAQMLLPTDMPVPTSAADARGLPASPVFEDAWQQLGGAEGQLGSAIALAHEVFCADQRFERGYMFWRNQSPDRGVIYRLVYADGDQDAGVWQSFVDTWDESQPQSAGYAAPGGFYEPVRGFGKVWQESLHGSAPPPAIGWAIENEQGHDQAQYQDFQGGVMLYSARLNRVFALFNDGTWRAVPAE